MTNKDFNNFLERFVNTCIYDVLATKAEFYASESDRLHNFKRAARIDDTTPEEALYGMQLKHRTTISDYIERANLTDTPLSEWREKITDTINYYILLMAMIEEAFEVGEAFEDE